MKNQRILSRSTTGNGGCGKSYLVKTIYHSLRKLLYYGAHTLDRERVLLLAPTGIAAINISGNTIHSALKIPIKTSCKCIPKLKDKNLSTLRNTLSEISVIIINEISMVSNILLNSIHQRLIEIFGCTSDLPFANRSVIVVGDLYQLPPVQGSPVLFQFKDEWANLSHLWKQFRIGELTETVRQKGDASFVSLLNRVASLSDNDDIILQSRIVHIDDNSYPWDALHIFAENYGVPNAK